MDVSKLKMKELAEVEKLAGYNMDEWQECPKIPLFMAIAYVVGKKTNKELTFEMVEEMGLEEMQALAGIEEDPKEITS